MAFWNNLSVVTKMGELSEVCDRLSSELENRCPDYLNFCKSIGMVKDPYNNKDYSGRYCDKLLKNLDKLDDVVGEELAPIVATLKGFNKVLWQKS